MNRGLLLKTFREAWLPTVFLALGLAAAEGLIAYALPMFFSEYYEQLLQLKFLQRMIAALLGAELSGPLNEEMIRLVAWVHPVAFALLWTHAVWSGTRVPVGEIDRGTIDLLLAFPASRRSVYISDSIVTLTLGLGVVVCATLGNSIGSALSRSGVTTSAAPVFAIAANFYCVYLAVAGLVYFVSALSDRRGRAIAAAVGILLASFLLNFLAQFWEPARMADRLCILHYYRPMHIAAHDVWPIADMLILTSTGLALWIAGALVFTRRDLRTL